MTHAPSSFSSLRRLSFIVAAVVASLAIVLPARVVAAQDTGLVDDATYVFETGETVSWGEDWDINEELSGVDDPIESLFLETQLAILSVVTMPSALDIEEARDLFIEGLTGESEQALTIDKDAYNDLSYSLDLLSIEGIEFGAFTLFRAGSGDIPTHATILLSPVDTFAETFASAQSSVTIDGEAMFDGVDGAGLQDLLQANSGQSAPDGDDAEQDEETPEPEATSESDEPSGEDEFKDGAILPDGDALSIRRVVIAV